MYSTTYRSPPTTTVCRYLLQLFQHENIQPSIRYVHVNQPREGISYMYFTLCMCMCSCLELEHVHACKCYAYHWNAFHISSISSSCIHWRWLQWKEENRQINCIVLWLAFRSSSLLWLLLRSVDIWSTKIWVQTF